MIYTDVDEFKKAPSPKLLILNYEIFPRLIKKLVRLKKINWMCFDEGHKISNRGSKQSKAASRMSWVHRKILLTGTPIEKKPTDVFAQFRWLSPDIFGKNWARFEEKYLEFKEIKFKGRSRQEIKKLILIQRMLKSKAKFREDLLPEFVELIKPISIRLEKGDVGIAKPRIRKILVPMTPRQRRLYESMKRHSIVTINEDVTVVAGMKAVNIMKRRQLASGFIYDENKDVYHVSSAKIRAVARLCDTLTRPTVIFCDFIPEVLKIAHTLTQEGYDVATIRGGMKRKDRIQIQTDFQDAQYDFLVCQNRAGGIGIDLWKASNAIVTSINHSFIVWDQLKSRLDKKGRQARVYILCSKNSIDEDLYDLVIMKGQTGRKVLSQLRR